MLFDNINTPADLKSLTIEELPALCDEVRKYLLQSVSDSGGHLASGLGALELTVALHYVYDTPNDRLIWDVGHQAYVHKLLTGRRDQLRTIKKKDGLCGFPRREESKYDDFGVGHSSTSISAALGMALAAKQQGIDRHSIAVIGDGALTAGLAYEALNHAGDIDTEMLVVLNDNDMSISPNVGGLSKYLARLLSGNFYSTMRENSKKILANTPVMKRFARRAEEHTKGMIMPSATLFEEMGFVYYGPVDGHDVIELVKILENIKDINEPKFLHVVTQKGKGYEPAEKDPIGYHAVSVFDLKAGVQKSNKPSTPTYTQVFGRWLCDMAAKDEKLVGITPAMREGSGLVEFSKEFPDRYYDVAIAEQHAVTLAAGMACDGLKPIVAIYSTFLQRAYDQLIHDVALQDLPVVFAIDRAGLVGSDGPTHSGNYDFSYLRCIPNMIVMAPSNEDECRQMLYTAYQQNGPTAVRYPRGKGTGVEPQEEMKELAVGKGEVLRKGNSIAILMFGSLLEEATIAAKAFGATLVNMRFVKPIDEDLIRSLSESHELFVTLEDNAIKGGAGSAVNEFLLEQDISMPVLNCGIPDKYIEHATREEQLEEIGLDGAGIVKQIGEFNQGKYSEHLKTA
ncbi:1-deoxy-D-xylulose-5-phosphate synthase [Cocleimonas sp. KMM 6892]|uniref:1-deoxy-D-xylulose-5-phosphate synthase n=1 Tax=unclassified Cocleimonas TaxID=2639732 RepID=UPI002DB6C8B8|nr:MULTISPECIES: 1-deoxy-D-xylulose-5-phosphate synthase [unclassified Cocleimonas]MEB8430959.1 1-deoxy-D-xylulose-5-phosphate synthase [Cocleimonas sp. KMM 6892]MEC4714269.1 1-deoxy-D-xylulose-5-phosphate synthase [Cocleimonas sp. KMM 6895]MEC4743600.1 1-deoxy-D-xylulose-5-phosphate synthase [Cocleimonas sp. KMM 6896]